jgi:hypothetical protein
MGVSQLANNAYMSQYRERRSFGVRDNAYMHIWRRLQIRNFGR